MPTKPAPLRLASFVVIAGLLVGCAPPRYLAKAPEPSGTKYELVGTATPARISVVDARRSDDKLFSFGVLPAELKIGETVVEPMAFLAEHLGKELASRGVPASTELGDNGVPKLAVKTFRILNHRANGFSPFVTLTFLSADIDTPSGAKRVGVFIKRGKVPVWSFDEVLEPIFNQPLSLVVKELASKIAKHTYGFQASDAETQSLISKLGGARSDTSYLDVYALGFTNNKKAIAKLAELAKDPDEYVRLAAISSLGTIGATEHFGLLKSVYEDPTAIWQDKAMSLKSIGDLGTPESRALLESTLRSYSADSANNDSRWTVQLLSLYLE